MTCKVSGNVTRSETKQSTSEVPAINKYRKYIPDHLRTIPMDLIQAFHFTQSNPMKSSEGMIRCTEYNII